MSGSYFYKWLFGAEKFPVSFEKLFGPEKFLERHRRTIKLQSSPLDLGTLKQEVRNVTSTVN